MPQVCEQERQDHKVSPMGSAGGPLPRRFRCLCPKESSSRRGDLGVMWERGGGRGIEVANMRRWARDTGIGIEGCWSRGGGARRHGGMLGDRAIGEERCRKAMSMVVSLSMAVAGGGEPRS